MQLVNQSCLLAFFAAFEFDPPFPALVGLYAQNLCHTLCLLPLCRFSLQRLQVSSLLLVGRQKVTSRAI